MKEELTDVLLTFLVAIGLLFVLTCYIHFMRVRHFLPFRTMPDPPARVRTLS